jgi:hypothetical protein
MIFSRLYFVFPIIFFILLFLLPERWGAGKLTERTD